MKLKQITEKLESSEIYLEQFLGRRSIESLVPKEKTGPCYLGIVHHLQTIFNLFVVCVYHRLHPTHHFSSV